MAYTLDGKEDKVIKITLQNSAGKPPGFLVSLSKRIVKHVSDNVQTAVRSFSELVKNAESKKDKVVDWIFPIFIPSKGRHGQSPDSVKAVFAHLPIRRSNDTQDQRKFSGSTLVFLVVEEQEVCLFVAFASLL